MFASRSTTGSSSVGGSDGGRGGSREFSLRTDVCHVVPESSPRAAALESTTWQRLTRVANGTGDKLSDSNLDLPVWEAATTGPIQELHSAATTPCGVPAPYDQAPCRSFGPCAQQLELHRQLMSMQEEVEMLQSQLRRIEASGCHVSCENTMDWAPSAGAGGSESLGSSFLGSNEEAVAGTGSCVSREPWNAQLLSAGASSSWSTETSEVTTPAYLPAPRLWEGKGTADDIEFENVEMGFASEEDCGLVAMQPVLLPPLPDKLLGLYREQAYGPGHGPWNGDARRKTGLAEILRRVSFHSC